MTDDQIRELAKQHANDPIAFARAIQEDAYTDAWGVCNYFAKLMKSTGHNEAASMAARLGEEMRKRVHGEAVSA
jgi:hypothetical protein